MAQPVQTRPIAAWRPTVHILLLVAAIVCLAIFTCVAFGWFGPTSAHAEGWLGGGLTLFAASFL